MRPRSGPSAPEGQAWFPQRADLECVDVLAHDLRANARVCRDGKPLNTFPDHTLDLLDHDGIDLIGDIVKTVSDLLQMIVDLGADNKIHRIGVAVLEEEL